MCNPFIPSRLTSGTGGAAGLPPAVESPLPRPRLDEEGRTIAQVAPPPIERQPSLPADPNPNLAGKTVARQSPPPAVQRFARHAALPDQASMIGRCGRPKDDLLFGLIKRSTNYKAVLQQLDQVRATFAQPQDAHTIAGQIARIQEALNELDQAVDSYLAGSDSQRFKSQMRDLKRDIGAERAGLERLPTAQRDWLPGLSLKEAMDYDRQGIGMGDIPSLQGQGKGPEAAARDQDQAYAQSLATVCEDARAMRARLRQGPPFGANQITDPQGQAEALRTLGRQAEFAVKAYVGVFLQAGKVPAAMQNLHRGELENRLEQLPLATLTPAERRQASQLLDLIRENMSLIYLNDRGLDQRFTVPSPRRMLLESYEEKLKDNQDKARDRFEGLLAQLTAGQLKQLDRPDQGSITENMLSANFAGLLRDRADARIDLGLLKPEQIKALLTQWVNGFAFPPARKDALINETLPKLIQQYQPHCDGPDANLQLGRVLGSGSFGVVRDATFNGDPVVVKDIELDSSMRDQGVFYGDLVLESRTQGGLKNNPYVPEILGFVVTGKNQARVIMKKVEGGDFKGLFEQVAAMHARQATPHPQRWVDRALISIHELGELAKAVEGLHREGLVHCDLKNANIMFDKNTLTPQPIDYGALTKTGDQFRQGNAATLPPEVDSRGGAQPASDIFAFGCIMFENITKRSASNMGHLIRERSKDGVESFVVDIEFAKPEWNNPPLSQCRDFMRACWRRSPGQRPTTEQILQAVRGEPITPARPGAPGLQSQDLHCLALFDPRQGYADQARDLLSEIYR